DNTSDRTPDVYRMRQVHQYRTNDLVGTMQGTKGGGLDTPRSYRMGLANDAGGASYVPDYVVSEMDAGGWMNYTRTVRHTNYQVYLRATRQRRPDRRSNVAPREPR